MRFLCGLFIVLLVGCGVPASQKSAGSKLSVEAVELTINGMSCNGCEMTIQSALGSLEGVDSVKADFKLGRALVKFNPSVIDTVQMRTKLREYGYTVKEYKGASVDSLTRRTKI